MIERPIFTGSNTYFEALMFGIIFGWQKRDDNGIYGTHIDSQVFDPRACILTLRRRSTKRSAGSAVRCAWAGTTVASARRAICPTVSCTFICASKYGASSAAGAVKRERLDFLADNPVYIMRFVRYAGRRSRRSANP